MLLYICNYVWKQIQKLIHFWFYPYTPMRISYVYSVSSVLSHIIWVGFEPTALAILEQFQTN